MLVLGIAVAVALLIPLLTGGSYTRLVMTDWRWSGLLFGGLALQLVVEFAPIPEQRWDDVGFALLLASYAAIVAFCARNLLLRGMAIVLIGVGCNALAIGLNGGMPVDVPPDFASKGLFEESIKHHPRDDDDRLVILGDVIVLRSPFDTVISFGDLIVAVGLCDVTFHASRRRKQRRVPHAGEAQTAATLAAGPAAAAAQTIDLGSFEAPSAPAVSRHRPAARSRPPSERSDALSARS